jgi:hypothetical protein
MGLKGLAIFAVLLTMLHAPAAAFAKTNDPSTANRKTQSPSASANSASQESDASTPESDSQTPRAYQPAPHITVANPPPTPKGWTWQEQVAWGANIVLAILAYFGIILGYQLLKKIDRQTEYAESAAESAAASAQAALLNAQAVIHSERPWILISVEPSRSIENSFTVVATNRGRTPARIIATADRARIAIDEKHLPKNPEYKSEKQGAPVVPIILVPGESAVIKPFCRDDVKGLCDSEERFKRIETWEEKVFLYGKVIYKDLISPPDEQGHETNWCCWYIHGRQNSGLVIAGPLEYNSHT